MSNRDKSISPGRRKFFKTVAGGAAAAVLGNKTALAAGQTATRPRALRAGQPPSPAWTRDLIVYEIAPKGFTSPHGPGTGNFRSLKAKLAYLQDLGINGIWLTGYSLCDPHHFYNIWTQYAVIEPDKLDPSLGTERDFTALIAEAHRRGIRIFLDVITHGLMADSPVIKKHPQWFQGGSWGMVDFDWFGGHEDLDRWWVDVWTNYVTKYGVDGYRLDVSIYRPDLWERIRRNAAAAGHPIVIFEESDAVIPGVTDFTQRENRFSPPGDTRPSPKKILARDVAGFFDRKFGKAGHYQVEIQYQDDGSRVRGSTGGHGDLEVHLKGLTADKTTRRAWVGKDAMPDGIPDIQLTVENTQARPIEQISVSDEMGGRWVRGLYSMISGHVAVAGQTRPSRGSLIGKPSLDLYVATLAHGWASVLLSCHDNGWEGFPLDKNPYGAQGSRALFGYSCLFTPMIPIFFSGEEFDATFRPIPWESPHLYGGREPGKGRWLYGAMLDWSELDQPRHRDMLEDVRKMMAVRKAESDILAFSLERERPNLLAVACEHDIAVPVPYIRWKDGRAILVAGNSDAERDANLKLQIPLEEIGLAGHANYRVSNLWPGAEPRTLREKELAGFACTVTRDKKKSGGLLVLKIEPSR